MQKATLRFGNGFKVIVGNRRAYTKAGDELPRGRK